ncbi:uncharacterized protein LOC110943323 [Helianthus annuus]|nr:uncharacterized protein LOC110943323 [Helianthus annuus]
MVGKEDGLLAIAGVWNNIMKVEAKTWIKGKRINSLMKGVPGNECYIRFRIDLWLGDTPLMFKWPRLFALERIKDCCVKDRVPASNEEILQLCCWDRSPVTSVEVAELVEYVNLLNGVVLSAAKDKWVWTPDGAGKFSTFSFKSLVSDDSSEDVLFSVKGPRWVPLKCRIFMWRLVLDRLPSREALRKRNILVGSDMCGLCGDGVESVDHLFSACSYSMGVWNRLSEWIKVPPIFAFSVYDLLEVHRGFEGEDKAKDIVRGLVLVACWAIWKARNDKIFSNGRGDFEDIFGEVRSLGFLWLKSRSKHRNLVWREWCNYPSYML